MSSSVLAAALVLAVPAPRGPGDCRAGRQAPCPDGLAGPSCDLPCPSARCAHALQCDDDGDTAGLALFGAPLFPLGPDWPERLVRFALLGFAVDHPGALGLARGLSPADLDLEPASEVRAGRLRLLRLRQRHRGVPVFAGDVTVITGPHGAIAVRGTLIDGRDEYAYSSAPSSAAAGEASILVRAAERSRLPSSELRVAGLRLVAFRRARALGWAGVVTHRGAMVAHVVVAADPSRSPADLLYYSGGEGHGLADEVAVTVRAEDLASPIFTPPIETADISQLPGGAPLLGSTEGDVTRLADRRVALLDATGATSRAQALASPPFAAASFDAAPDTRAFVFQSAYVWLQSIHAHTDELMHGRWDSLLPFFGMDSAVAPGEFAPRLVATVDTAANLCGDAGYCLTSAWGGAEDDPSEALRHPATDPPYELVGALYIKGTGFPPTILPHEYGHFVDLFAAPGLFYEPHACALCWSSCEPGTTDESLPLTETFANLLAMWHYTELFPTTGGASVCDTLAWLSSGDNRAPHNHTCRPTGAEISYFVHDGDPECPQFDGWIDRCDRPEPDDIDNNDGIGLCSRRAGYAVDSWHQALWELLHGETCAPAPPFDCQPLPTLASVPASRVVGEALLFAAQAGPATYDAFADDLVTYVACNYGQAAYDEFNEVLCHHKIRGCDLPAPVVCDLCGDGVRTGAEPCDGGDLGGQTCEAHGLVSGALACDAACSLDLSRCEQPDGTSSTTAADPTTGPPPTTSSGPETSDTERPGGLFIASELPETGDAGCGCRDDDGSPSAPATLALLLLRRRKRR